MRASLEETVYDMRTKFVENLQELCINTREEISNACMDTEKSWDTIIQTAQDCQEIEQLIANINQLFNIEGESDSTPQLTNKSDRNAYMKGGKLRPGYAMPASKFTQYVLDAVKQEGGSTTRNKVLEIVSRKIGHAFNKYDLEVIKNDSSKRKRWEMAMDTSCRVLTTKNLLTRQHGIWTITIRGNRITTV